MAVGRLGSHARRNGRTAFTAAAVLLGDELVECVVQGRFMEANGCLVLTNDRLLFVNEKLWRPDVVTVPVDAALTVQGWQDDKTAALVFQRGTANVVIDRIVDRIMAQEMAHRIRAKAGTPGT